MAIVQKVDYLNRGTKLVRHYDDEYDIISQVDGVPFYQAIEDQLSYDFNEYYGRKFFEKVTLNVYCSWAPMIHNYPGYCFDLGDHRSDIHVRFIEHRYGGDNSYKFPANISHEFGHAYANWTQCFYHLEFNKLFEKMVAGVEYNKDVYPWNSGENPHEQFANMYRILAGTLSTRGVSQPPYEKITEGFEDPKNHKDWKYMLQLLPETCGYWRKFGLKNNTLTWNDYYFQFQDNSGTWIAHTNYYSWHKWTGKWERMNPTYDVP